MTAQTVFYAWQSDTPQKLNHYFIRDAAREAVDSLADDAAIEDAPRLDHDTRDVPGTPDIPQTIFTKIDQCSVFLADLTFVGQTDAEQPKLVPNPNVMIELGRATKSVGPERIICVMNTAFGPPDQLPFDLRHRRHPIQYHLDPQDTSKLSQVKKTLVEDLRIAIRAVLQNAPPTSAAEAAADQRAKAIERIQQEQEHFEQAVLTNQFHDFTPKRGILALSLIPEIPLDPPLNFSKLRARNVRFPCICGTQDRPDVFADYALVASRDTADQTRQGVVRLDRFGRVFAADGTLLGNDISDEVAKRYAARATGYIPSLAYEESLIGAAFSYLQVLHSLGVRGPIQCLIVLFQIRGFYLAVRPSLELRGPTPRLCQRDELRPDAITIHPDDDVSSIAAVACLLKPAFDYIWLEFGYDHSHNFNDSGQWNPE